MDVMWRKYRATIVDCEDMKQHRFGVDEGMMSAQYF